MPELVLGPVLRHVDDTAATVWVETGGPCTVDILGSSTQTWCVGGHHYALVRVVGLSTGVATPYQVRLDGELVWPPADSPHPPSRIRTVDPHRPLRLAFGSCRYAAPQSMEGKDTFGADALDAYADRMAGMPDGEWPDALLLLGDQVYADDTSPVTQEVIKRRRDVSRPPRTEVANFEEYTTLYHESWKDPQVRWLMSTVPTSMIFDDHDVHDDWNTSHAWREDAARTDWWEERITGALMSYWIYQHIGNLHPDVLDADETYQKVRSVPDAEPLLREFAQAADREADGEKGARWSYRRDFGRVRLLVIDSRCGRILADDARSMVSEPEFRWISAQVDGDYDHLLVGTSLPWLLPRAVHDLESWDEALCRAERPSVVRWLGERARRGADMEHWAAFRNSFDGLAALLACVGRGEHAGARRPPATIAVLSGDVHHAYVAEAHYPQPVSSRVYQLVCSPIHQGVPRSMRIGFQVGWSKAAERLARLIGRTAPVPALPLSWQRVAGPYFGNQLATLILDGRSARFRLERADAPDGGPARMVTVADLPLT